MTSSTTKNNVAKSYPFLSGGGEMGLLTRTKNWSKTSLGSADSWPQSLRTTVSIILNSKFPMFLFWGPELICFYNDAYRPSLGENGKHPEILGTRAEGAWEEIWDIIKPLIDQVLQGGGATWSEDQLIPIFRNGKLENVYWTFSYSPVNDESGKTNGVLVTCNETTGKVNLLREIKENKDQLEFAIDATELGTWDYNPLTNKFNGNKRLKEWFGIAHEGELDLSIATNAIAEDDRERVKATIAAAMQFSSGGRYEIDYSIIHPFTQQERIVRAKGSTTFNTEKKACRFNGTLQDISAWVLAKRAIEKSEKRFRSIVRQAPLGITIIRAEGFVVEMANETYLEIVGKEEQEFVGKPLFQSLPEIEEVVASLLAGVLNRRELRYWTGCRIKTNFLTKILLLLI